MTTKLVHTFSLKVLCTRKWTFTSSDLWCSTIHLKRNKFLVQPRLCGKCVVPSSRHVLFNVSGPAPLVTSQGVIWLASSGVTSREVSSEKSAGSQYWASPAAWASSQAKPSLSRWSWKHETWRAWGGQVSLYVYRVFNHHTSTRFFMNALMVYVNSLTVSLGNQKRLWVCWGCWTWSEV